MDRWDDDEDYKHPKQLGRVARLGMGGFVKSEDAGTSGQPDKQVTIEIVQSKKEQKQRAIAASQPKQTSEPPKPTAPPPPPPPRLPNLPDWVGGSVPSGAHLKVLKEGQCVQRIELCKAATIFGRNPAADVPLEHASISRTHAALCTRASSSGGSSSSSKLYLLDFGSVHGTFLNNIRVGKGCPVEVTPGSVMRFGASTRHFVLDIQARPASTRRPLPQEGGAEEGGDGSMAAPARKKGRVRFGDEDDVGGLEEVLGYSDSSTFQPLVGPSPGATGGQFAALTTSTATPPPPTRAAEPRGDASSTAVEGGGGSGGGGSSGAAGGGSGGAKVKPQLQEFITSLRSKSRGLYEELQ